MFESRGPQDGAFRTGMKGLTGGIRGDGDKRVLM
jgi:hypothetical protein